MSLPITDILADLPDRNKLHRLTDILVEPLLGCRLSGNLPSPASPGNAQRQ